MKLNDGEEMSKVIIGKALKNNEELTKNEENEIKFARKYQILSKNTALFAEFINDESQQNKLIKVQLNLLGLFLLFLFSYQIILSFLVR